MKLIEVVADAGNVDTVQSVAQKHNVHDFRLGEKGEDGRQAMRLVVADDKVQAVLDMLQSLVGTQESARILVVAIESALPKPPEDERREEDAATATREALYADVERNAQLDRNYVLLVFLSTVVAAIGLLKDNVAVVIGAMVIAPLLGPNLALALGTALGDLALIRKAAVAGIAGIGVALALAFAIGALWSMDLRSNELLARTDVGMDSVALALASGAAAALSVTTGLSSVLVGVMVAVALLPPAAALGMMLGSGEFALASGAGLLLAVNIVCVNLAARLVFLARGIRPRTWLEKQQARRATTIYLVIWVLTLLLLLAAIYARRELTAPGAA